MKAAAVNVILVGAGGLTGSVLRYLVSGLVHRWLPSTFPYGTLAVNVAGCLAIGFLAGVMDSRQAIGSELRLFLLIGLLGGFTTFSTFGYETIALARVAEQAKALANVAAHITAGLAAVWLGIILSKAW